MAKVLSSAVFDAVRANDTAAVTALLEFDESALHAQGQYGDTMLGKACAAGAYDVARLLLEAGAAVNAANARSQTPLYEACKGGYEAIVVMLLSYGADATRQDVDGVDCLSVAAYNGHSGCVDAIVAKLPPPVIEAYQTVALDPPGDPPVVHAVGTS